MFEKLKTRLKEWRRKQIWSPDKQLYHLRVQVQEDRQWLAHDTVARELTERYLLMLDEHWESQPREFIWQFRERIGLDPHKRSNVRDKLAPAAWRAGQQAQNGPQAQRLMTSVPRRWGSA